MPPETDSTALPCAPVACPCVPGLTSATRVLTERGERPVGTLRAGDRLIGRRGFVRLRALHARRGNAGTVWIRAGSLGHRGDSDVRLSPETGVLVRDWRARALLGTETAVIAANDLVDGEFVIRDAPRSLQLFDLDLDLDEGTVIYADGLEIAAA